MRFSPRQVDTKVGGSVTVALIMEAGSDVAATPMTLKFDPRILKLNDAVRGDFMAQGDQQPLFSKNIDNASGTVTIQLGRLPRTPGSYGSGVLFNLNFEAVGKGVATVTIPDFAVLSSQGQKDPARVGRLTVTVK